MANIVKCTRCGETIYDDPDSLLEHGVLKHKDKDAQVLMSMLHSLRQDANKIGGNTPEVLEKTIQFHIDNNYIRKLFKQLKK